MPGEKNTTARLIVPIAGLALGALVIVAVFTNSSRSGRGPSAPDTASAPVSGQDEEAGGTPAGVDAPAGQTVAPAASPQTPTVTAPAALAADLSQLRVRLTPPPPSGSFGSIGSIDPESGYLLEVAFAPQGAGVDSIKLSRHQVAIDDPSPYVVQELRTRIGQNGSQIVIAPLAAQRVVINGQEVSLFASGAEDKWVWRQTARTEGEARFEALVVDADDAPVARVERVYRVSKGAPADETLYDIVVQQRIVNMTGGSLDVGWAQYGGVDLPSSKTTYGGDPRRVRFGATLGPTKGSLADEVRVMSGLGSRRSIAGRLKDPLLGSTQLWPTRAAVSQQRELSWAATTNRYFTFVLHPLVGDAAVSKRLPFGAEAHAVRLGAAAKAGDDELGVELRAAAASVAPGEALDLSFSAYAGPLWRKTLGSERYRALGMDGLVVYNIGGMCAWCTFQPIARFLLWMLGLWHDYILHDWALSILFLVVCVRGVLHPVTKRTQINMTRFGKQMQAIGPKQKAIQEKYADDPKRKQEEIRRLFQEEGVNPANALGCLPMFMQTPIWIALFAMLFYAFDLRHEPAFFGVFQQIGGWGFLADLSAPDRFIGFASGITIPIFGEVSSINVLPLLLGVVFYLQQKYLTPPTSATMTPEQVQTQKIMKIMMVVMFPLFMYNAPSGLSIYFVTNSTLGILESRYVRAHIDQMDLSPKKPDPAKRKRVRNQAPANPFDKRNRFKDEKPKPKRRPGKSR